MKKKLLCVVLVVVMCLSVASVAMAAGESPTDGWVAYDPTTVPEGYQGYVQENAESDNALLNDYAAQKYPDAKVEEIGTFYFMNEAGEFYEGNATLYFEDASVKAGDKVTVLCLDVYGNIIEVEATVEDGAFSFNVPTPGAYSYIVVKASADSTTTTNKTTTSAKSPKTGGEDR